VWGAQLQENRASRRRMQIKKSQVSCRARRFRRRATADNIDVVQRLNRVNGCKVRMEFDTGAPCAIISKKPLGKIRKHYQLLNTDRKFASYTGHLINCIGRVPVNAKIGTTTRKLDLYVVDGTFGTLFGREWIAEFTTEISLEAIFGKPDLVHLIRTESVNLTSNQEAQLDGVLRPPVKLHFKPDAKPVFSKAREIPFALRDAYAKEIDTKLGSGFYKRVEYSEWVSTTHVVTKKKNGKPRITGNYKPTLNLRIMINEYPIPRVEHIFNKMRGAKILPLGHHGRIHAPRSRRAHAMTLNTPTHSLIRPTRVVYGVANIPPIWQRRMEVLRDL
jgi:hypothetical protein